MNIQDQIVEWFRDYPGADIFLVSVEEHPGSRKLSVFIDGDRSVNVEDCRNLSRFLGEKLDETGFGTDVYEFEVSSPGVDKPLRLIRQFPKHLGRELKVTLKAGGELDGKLEEVKENGILIALKDPKKGYRDMRHKEISMTEIAEIKVTVSFKNK